MTGLLEAGPWPPVRWYLVTGDGAVARYTR